MLYRHVTVIDPVLPDAQTLVNAAHQLGHTTLILTQDEASLPSLVQRLENLGRVDALHVLCHGEPGQVRLGNTLISPANIDALAPSLQRLGACVEEAILLYSCHTASGPQGQELLARLGNLLGTTVSASSTAIGHSTLGGNWILDQSTGPHSAQALSIPDYAGVLATTLTFSADESGWDAQAMAVDGEGGSTDFPGMELQIFNISDAAGTKLDHINWYGADTFYADDGFHGVTIDWDNHSGEWAGMAIQSADGAEFQLQSFDFYDWGSYPRQGENVTVIGYRDNVQVGSQTFTSNGDDNRKNVAITPSTGFEAVDEVRIVFEDGAGYIALNNITVDVAIPPNTAPTASDDNLSIRYNSSHTFALADFSFSDVDGDTLHHVTINTVPTSGSLILDGNPVNDGDTISAMDLSDGKLVYSPASGASGNGYASLVFTVNDGTVDAAGSNTLTLDVGTPPPPPPPPTPDPEPEPDPDPEPDPEPEPEPQPDPDTDGDGIPQDEEADVPSLNGDGVGDGNGDGIADSEQGNVASLIFLESDRAESDPDGVPEIYLTLAAISAESALKDLVQLNAPEDRPDDLEMPLGLLSFGAELEQGNDSATFELYLNGDLNINGYWKQDSDGDWVNLASEAYGGSVSQVNDRLLLTFTIEDGGQFDDDGQVNGVITDPGAPGFRAPEPEPEPEPPTPPGAFDGLPVEAFFDWFDMG